MNITKDEFIQVLRNLRMEMESGYSHIDEFAGAINTVAAVIEQHDKELAQMIRSELGSFQLTVFRVAEQIGVHIKEKWPEAIK